MSLVPFKNEPYVDFSAAGPAEQMKRALLAVKERFGEVCPLIIDGERILTDARIVSVNPANPSEVIAECAKSTAELTDRAIRRAHETFRSWGRTSPEHRARILLKAAAIMRRRIFELSALLVCEESKPWIEAYADTAEAIDFLEFYAREMMRLGGSQPTGPWPGEENELRYMPLGVVAVISPWNFPLAIMAGMTTAAVVCGNTVVLKPASTAPIIAARFMEIMEEAGLPAGVINYVPGSGAEVGDVMTDHPLTRVISFTGSKEVGLRINERAAKTAPGQIWIKRTVLEMGGKDFVAVDEGVDLEMAAREATISAFGFQGQKCSAGSRLIVHEKVFDEMVERMCASVKTLTVGDPSRENVYMGAVIDGKAQKTILDYIEVGKKEARRTAQGMRPEGDGYFVPPTVLADVAPTARVAQEEIFGPVVAIVKAKDFEDMVAIANGTEFGLTGALITNSRERIERARVEMEVGNLYFNRKCTGAYPGVQPFGGFNMSGTDSKAGGSDYLKLFMQAKSITERF